MNFICAVRGWERDGVVRQIFPWDLKRMFADISVSLEIKLQIH
jgi:hypothetical protein